MTWTYKNKKTGEVVNSPCVDSRYWTPEWKCISGPYTQKIDFPIKFEQIEQARNGVINQKMTSINPKDELEFMENLHCQPDKKWHISSIEESGKEIWDASLPQTYQPETIAIPTLEVENIVDALEAGLEHAQTVLAEHDTSLGRTTRQNKSWAETLEKDITLLRTRITFLKGKLVGATTHYP